MAEFEASPGGDPHNWNSLANYLFLHQKHLDSHPFVRAGQYSLPFEITDQPRSRYDRIKIQGLVVCTNGLVVEITKIGDLDRTRGRRVRISRFRYNAHFPRKHNVLRYDNMHADEPDIYHRHVFNPATGHEVIREDLTRTQFPVMHQVFDELMQMFPPQ